MKLKNKITNLFWELKLNIDTRGSLQNSVNKDYVSYSTVNYSTLEFIFKNISNKSDKCFVDIGCGKGRVLCYAATFNFRKIIGIEIDKEIILQTENNLKKLRNKKSNVDLFQQSAETFNYEDVDVFYLFNPFNENILENVIQNITKTLEKHKRDILFIYVNPMHDHVFNKFKYLHLAKEHTSPSDHKISFWCNYNF